MNWFREMFKEAAPFPQAQPMSHEEERENWRRYRGESSPENTQPPLKDGIESAVISGGDYEGNRFYPVLHVYYSDGTKNETEYFYDFEKSETMSISPEEVEKQNVYDNIEEQYKQWAEQHGLDYVPMSDYEDGWTFYSKFEKMPVSPEPKIYKAERGWEKDKQYSPTYIEVEYNKDGKPATAIFGSDDAFDKYKNWAAKMNFEYVTPSDWYENQMEEYDKGQREMEMRYEEEKRQRSDLQRQREEELREEEMLARMRGERPPKAPQQAPGRIY